jgi:hypothetical protein
MQGQSMTSKTSGVTKASSFLTVKVGFLSINDFTFRIAQKRDYRIR